MRETRPASREAALRWVQWLLVSAGLMSLAVGAALVAESVFFQHAGRRSLQTVPSASSAPPAQQPTGTAGVAPPPGPLVRGAALGTIRIGRVGLSAVVLHGSDERTLRRGPGHLENTPLPGAEGNTVIAGHRDSFFRPLRHVRIGDDILIDTPAGRFEYRVTSLRVVKPGDLSVLDQHGDDALTLITCYPFRVLGNAPDRFIVRAERLAGAKGQVRGPAVEVGPRPPVAAPGAAPRPAAGVRVMSDDDRIRRAIERFRTTYNARLVSHGDAGAPLRAAACDVNVAERSAVAVCSAAPDRGRPNQAWTVTLRQDERRDWAIRSVAMNLP